MLRFVSPKLFQVGVGLMSVELQTTSPYLLPDIKDQKVMLASSRRENYIWFLGKYMGFFAAN